MPFCNILLYLVADKRHPGAAEISTIQYQNYSIIWGVLGVLVSYEIARVIELVVGSITEKVKGFWVFFWGGLEGSTLVEEVCLSPIIHFFPLWKSSTAQDLVPNTM